MVISSTLTSQLDDIQAPVPLSRTRPRSVPVYTSRSPSSTPNPSRLSQQKSTSPKKITVERPPFVNFASAYINPYVPLKPVRTPSPTRRSRPKTRHLKRRQRREQVISAEGIRSESNATPVSELTELTSWKNSVISHQPVEIIVADRAAYARDFVYRRQVVINHRTYRVTVDSWRATSLNHLILLIGDLVPNQVQVTDRLWIIFYWISQNIRYDLEADIHMATRQMRAEDVFRGGKASSQGYTAIFQYLSDVFKIRCETIEGYAKDYNFKLENPNFTRVNHTWNVVQIDRHWYFVDVAWGTGYIDGNHEYKTDLKTFYFLTNPEEMIYDHLPVDSRWQLLGNPIAMQDYLQLPHVHSYYFVYGLSIVSAHSHSMLSFDSNRSLAEVFIRAPDDVQLTCAVKNDPRSRTLTQYDGNRQLWQCLIAPYKTGFHTLIIFATRLASTNIFRNVIEFGVEVSDHDLFRRRTLPITFEKFLEHKCQILSPMNGRLKRGTKVQIRCRIPNAITARISADGIWMDEVPMRTDLFKQEINVPERELIVYARFNHSKSSKNYDGLIRYLVEK